MRYRFKAVIVIFARLKLAIPWVFQARVNHVSNRYFNRNNQRQYCRQDGIDGWYVLNMVVSADEAISNPDATPCWDGASPSHNQHDNSIDTPVPDAHK